MRPKRFLPSYQFLPGTLPLGPHKSNLMVR
jgi:hypothetical protein